MLIPNGLDNLLKAEVPDHFLTLLGQPFNEMKKKSLESVSRKRRKRVPASSDSIQEISRLESELDRASDLLDEVVATASGKEIPEKRKRRKRIVPVDAEEAEEIEQELVKRISD